MACSRISVANLKYRCDARPGRTQLPELVDYTFIDSWINGDQRGPIRFEISSRPTRVAASLTLRSADYTGSMAQTTEARRGPEPPDLSEKGGVRNGEPQRSNDRLFMQFLAFGNCLDVRPLAQALTAAGIPS